MSAVAPWHEDDDLNKQVYHLRMGGVAIPDIAEQLGITTDHVIRLYRERVVEAAKIFGGDERQMVINTELVRLDALQAPFWADAISGDIKAGEFVLKVMAHRMKMLGLDQMSAESKEQVANVLIVGGSQQEFLDALKSGRNQYVAGELQEDGGESEEVR